MHAAASAQDGGVEQGAYRAALYCSLTLQALIVGEVEARVAG